MQLRLTPAGDEREIEKPVLGFVGNLIVLFLASILQ